MEERNMAKVEKQKFNRVQRREIDRMNEKLDELLTKYFNDRAIYGNSRPVVRGLLERRWVDYCNKHNNGSNHIKADPDAFHRQLQARENMEAKIAEEMERQSRETAYSGWVLKVELRFPRLLWRWRMFNHLTKGDYVKNREQKFQGSSPRGSWL